MAATPQYAVFSFIGLRTKRTYSVDAYVSDVADALVTFDAGAGAGTASPTSWTAPEPVILKDFAIVTGTQDTTKVQLLRNNQPTGDFLRYTMHLTTSAVRPGLVIGVPGMAEFRAIQKA